LTAEAEATRLATLDGETLDWLKSLHFLDAAPEDVYLAAEDHFNKTLREPIQIAITGQSGVGKSTLVNTLRGLPPTALSAAPVSPLQMTGVKAPYKEDGYASPYSPGVVYHDLPGCGTAAVPACGPLYYQAFAMSRFDAFILVTSGRVEDSDLQIYREIVSQGQISMANHGVIAGRSGRAQGSGSEDKVGQASHRPIFIIRSKADVDVQQELEDFGRSVSLLAFLLRLLLLVLLLPLYKDAPLTTVFLTIR
jgi:energy-coupling factor transporter ATP-binding protein EcfA2